MTIYVLGLDGADLSLLRDFATDGDLPTIGSMIHDGVVGELESTYPPITCPAWQSYATGKNPGKLGVYGWMKFDRETKEIGFNDGHSFFTKTYFEVLTDHGKKVGIVNIPTTHPADRYGEVFTIAGIPGEEDENFTNPAGLREELHEAVPDYKMYPEMELSEAKKDEALDMARNLFDARIRAASWLANEKDCDLLHVTLFGTDTLQHYYWDQPDVLKEIYQFIDSRLEDLLEEGDTDAAFLMSDHGFTEMTAKFSPNQWLTNRGDLHFEVPSVQNVMEQTGITRQRAKNFLLRYNLLDLARTAIPAWMRRKALPNNDGSVDLTNVTIDWKRTKAVHLGHGPLYINEDAFESDEEKSSYLSELKRELGTLTTPDGDEVVAEIYESDEIYTDPTRYPPDLLIEYALGIDAANVAVNGPVFGGTTGWKGVHRQSGIFGAVGIDIAQTELQLRLCDIAPTILHYLGVPVPSDMDGVVKQEIFTGTRREADVELGPPTEDKSKTQVGDEEAVERQLRQLGYIE